MNERGAARKFCSKLIRGLCSVMTLGVLLEVVVVIRKTKTFLQLLQEVSGNIRSASSGVQLQERYLNCLFK